MYKFGNNINKTALIKEHKYKYSDGVACKIIIPNNPSSQDVQLLVSKWNETNMLEIFDIQDTELFVSYCIRYTVWTILVAIDFTQFVQADIYSIDYKIGQFNLKQV